jgi:hypothetical protein
MKFIVGIIKLLIIAVLSMFYWPLNTAFLYMQKHYRIWQVEDRVSFYIATPLYYILFIVTSILSVPLENMGEAAHPGLDGFQ